MVAAASMADSYYYDPDDEAEGDSVSAIVARVGEALVDGAESVDWRHDDYLTTDRMEIMAQAGFLMRNAVGGWVVPDPLRITVARPATTVLAGHLLPGIADGLLPDDS